MRAFARRLAGGYGENRMWKRISVPLCGVFLGIASPGFATSPLPFPFDPPGAGTELPGPPLYKAEGADGGRAQFTVRVARDLNGWRAMWVELGKTIPADFVFDPERSTAVAVHFGHGPPRASRISIIEAGERNEQLVVTYAIVQPTTKKAQTVPVRSPWAIALFAKQGLPVVVHSLNIWHPVWFEENRGIRNKKE